MVEALLAKLWRPLLAILGGVVVVLIAYFKGRDDGDDKAVEAIKDSEIKTKDTIIKEMEQHATDTETLQEMFREVHNRIDNTSVDK